MDFSEQMDMNFILKVKYLVEMYLAGESMTQRRVLYLFLFRRETRKILKGKNSIFL